MSELTAVHEVKKMKWKFFLMFLISFFYSASGQIEQIALRGEKVTSIIIFDGDSLGHYFYAGTKNNGFYEHSFTDDDSI